MPFRSGTARKVIFERCCNIRKILRRGLFAKFTADLLLHSVRELVEIRVGLFFGDFAQVEVIIREHYEHHKEEKHEAEKNPVF